MAKNGKKVEYHYGAGRSNTAVEITIKYRLVPDSDISEDEVDRDWLESTAEEIETALTSSHDDNGEKVFDLTIDLVKV